MPSLEPSTTIENRIVTLRGHRVLLDFHLAELYGVPTKRLNEQVRRNLQRFPADFMFQLNEDEEASLRSQFATLKLSRGRHRKYRSIAFTEQGIAMLSSVLHSDQAIEVNIEIMRAFVRIRAWLQTHADLAQRLDELEQRYDQQFKAVFDAIRELMAPPVPERPRIGFE